MSAREKGTLTRETSSLGYPLVMSKALSTHESLGPEAMWSAMRVLLERVFGVLERDTVLDDCLDILVDLLGADRGLVLVVDETGASRTINARGKGKTLSVLEREEISKTIIHRALETGECVIWDVSSVSAWKSASISNLQILAALAAPLHRPGAPLGEPRAVLYVDIRDPRKHVEKSHVEFFMSSALLIGALLDQRARAPRTIAHDWEKRSPTRPIPGALPRSTRSSRSAASEPSVTRFARPFTPSSPS